MELSIIQQIESVLEYLTWTILWNKYFAVMFLILGLYLTVGMRFFQFRHFGDIFYNTLGTLFRGKGDAKEEKVNKLSSWGAFATALGGTVGSGNIAGVASAVALGGPGALFWMWAAALVGMATKMSEIILTQTFKQKYPDGTSYGSAAFYIEKGLVEGKGWKWCKILSALFVTLMIAQFFITPGPYTMCETLQAVFNLSRTSVIIFAILLTLLELYIFLGGIPRIVKFAEAVVPVMVLAYFAAGLYIILMNIPVTIAAVKSIFVYAFTPHAAVGGFAGVTVSQVVQLGVARSVYSNEAGWGSSPIIHAGVDVDHPARQGMWGAMEVFLDTIVVCTISGLIVIITGEWETGRGGAGSVANAFTSVFGPAGGIALAAFLIIFSMTTATGWFSYLESLLMYCMANKTHEQRMKVITFCRYTAPLLPLCFGIFFLYTGTVPSVVWMALDLQTGIPVYVNVIALSLLSPIIFKKTKEFEDDFLKPEKIARKAAKNK